MTIPRLLLYQVFILLVLFTMPGCSQDSQEKVNIKSEAGDIFFEASQIFGESKPMNSGVEVAAKDTYFFTMEGDFTNPWDRTAPKADKISFRITQDGLIDKFRAYKGANEVWEVNLPHIHWRKLGGVHVTNGIP